jgi:hypothetical protein
VSVVIFESPHAAVSPRSIRMADTHAVCFAMWLVGAIRGEKHPCGHPHTADHVERVGTAPEFINS